MEHGLMVPLTHQRGESLRTNGRGKVWMAKPPYFTPWTPPLGIAILKAFLAQHHYTVSCFDYNTDPLLWGMHLKYFAALQQHEEVSRHEGFSKLWPVLNAHMLAYVNGAEAAACRQVLEAITPLYRLRCGEATVDTLIDLVAQYFQRLDDVTGQIDFSDYALVGTSTYTTSLASALYILRQVKRKHPEITTVMGGGIFADDLALGSDNLNTLVEGYPYVDHAILGEGELLFLKLLQGDLAHKRVITIADLKGQTLNMQEVPSPDFSDFDIKDYYHLSIEGARSCPFQCSFCSETVQWGDYRKKPMALFVDQVTELARKFQINSFFMGDSLMNPYLIDFSNRLLEKQSNILYDGYLRADRPVGNRERTRAWARSGLHRVRLGIETASARILSAMDKMTTPEVISEVLKSLASAGIRTTTYWIVGYPGETEEDFQETLDFIRQHHRFIYELEAHPYYYYPYGQIGSRLFESRSLYPDEVTEVIKFRLWDIPDVSPTREERFDRLHRVSQLALSLGIPNIYSMADRYQAEDRWRLLHPLTVEVYQGSTITRGPAQPRPVPLDAVAVAWDEDALPQTPGPDAVLCYEAHVSKKLDEQALRTAIVRLIEYNEMLQMRFEGGKYVPAYQAAEIDAEPFLYVYDGKDGDPAGDELKRDLIAQLSSTMRPDPQSSIRLMILKTAQPGCDVLLLAHRALADSQSVIHLFEDLFRIYEQTTNGLAIALAPLQTEYREVVKSLTSRGLYAAAATGDSFGRPSQPAEARRAASGGGPGTVRQNRVRLDEAVTRRMLSDKVARRDITVVELLTLALLRSLAKMDETGDLQIDVTVDFRALDEGFRRAGGALTGVCQLPRELMKEDDLLLMVEKLRPIMRAQGGSIPLRPTSRQSPGSAPGVLLNFEYCIPEGWLGGDSWVPKGFVPCRSRLARNYGLEIAPAFTKDGMDVLLIDEDGTDAARIAEGLMNHSLYSLKSSIQILLNYLTAGMARYGAAKRK